MCSKPLGVSRVLAFVQENDREFLQGVNHGLPWPPKTEAWNIAQPVAESDVAKALQQIEKFARRKGWRSGRDVI